MQTNYHQMNVIVQIVEAIMNKPQWPTLEDRLNHPLKDELKALQQLKQVLPLSKQAQELYDKLSKESIQETRNNSGRTTNNT